MVQFNGWFVYIGEEFAIWLMLDISKKYLHKYHKMELRSSPNVIYQFCSSWTCFVYLKVIAGATKVPFHLSDTSVLSVLWKSANRFSHNTWLLHQYWNGIECVTEYIERIVCSSLQEFTYLWKYASSFSSRSLKTQENTLFIHSHKHSWFRLFNMT